jgi:hypothetical protein
MFFSYRKWQGHHVTHAVPVVFCLSLTPNMCHLAELCGGWNWTRKMQIGPMNEDLMWDVLVYNTNVGRENEN